MSVVAKTKGVDVWKSQKRHLENWCTPLEFTSQLLFDFTLKGLWQLFLPHWTNNWRRSVGCVPTESYHGVASRKRDRCVSTDSYSTSRGREVTGQSNIFWAYRPVSVTVIKCQWDLRMINIGGKIETCQQAVADSFKRYVCVLSCYLTPTKVRDNETSTHIKKQAWNPEEGFYYTSEE